MEAKSTDTFEWLAMHYYDQYAEANLKSAAQSCLLLHRHVPEKLRKTQIHLITRKDIKLLIGQIAVKTPPLAMRVLNAMSSVFRWGVEEAEVISTNPCAGIRRIKTRSRSRVLSDEEIPLFWREFEKHGEAGVALKFLLLTGQRPGEVARINRRHIKDGCWWQMPGDAVPELHWRGTKNGCDHRCYVVDAALRILPAGADHGEVFSCPPKLQGVMQKTMVKISKQLGVERAVPHDLRRTHGTAVCKLLGFGGMDAMNRVQNHRESRGVGSIYNQYEYDPEKQRVMEMVAAHFMGLIEGRLAAANVISADFRHRGGDEMVKL
jgi:integrase